MRKKYLLQSLLGLSLGAVLCVALARHTRIDGAMLHDLLQRFDPLYAGLCLLLSMAMLETGVRKWAYLDVHFDGHTLRPHRYYLRHYIWQNWLAQILPGTVALILGRALVTHAGGEKNWKRGLRSGLIDQLSELFVLLAFLPGTFWQLYTQGSFAFWLGQGLLTLLAATLLGHKILPRVILPAVIGWSFLRIAAITLRLVFGALVFALPVGSAAIAYATPLATLTALLPLTPGNLGLAEWGWTYALQLWQVDLTAAALYLLSFRLLAFALQSLLLLAIPALRAR